MKIIMLRVHVLLTNIQAEHKQNALIQRKSLQNAIMEPRLLKNMSSYQISLTVCAICLQNSWMVLAMLIQVLALMRMDK
jgi:hypothetical protein